jgi:hypothetical protein
LGEIDNGTARSVANQARAGKIIPKSTSTISAPPGSKFLFRKSIVKLAA